MKLNLLVLTILLTSISTSTHLWSAQKHRPSYDEQEQVNPKRVKECASTCHICLETEEEENGSFITPEAFNGLLTCIHRQVHATCLTAALAENNRCPICRSAGIRQVQAQVVAQAPTNLHIAAEQGNLAEVNQLIAAGADVNAADEQGRTPLHWAADQGNLVAVQALIDAGADVNPANNEQRTTPLHHAAFQGHVEVVQALLASGANVNPLDRLGGTPLHWAALLGHVAVAQALIDAGANVNAGNEEGYTPLHITARLGYLPMVQVLLRAGADRTIRTSANRTAAQMASTDAIRTLIQEYLPATQ